MTAPERPYRHLCSEADLRDSMSNEEFWEHVMGSLVRPVWDDDDAGPELDPTMTTDPCPECGSTGACGWDSEGRPMIHATAERTEP